MEIKQYFSTQQLDRIRHSERAQSLIDAGLDLFGEFGLKGTTTRMLAEASGANAAAIAYYFSSKNGLYLAVMNYIVQQINEMTSADIESVKAKVQQPISKQEALSCYQAVMEGLLRHFLEDSGPERWIKLVMREYTSPTEAYDIFYNQFFKHVQRLMCQLIGIMTDQDPASDPVVIQAHALFGQTLGFLIARESLRRGLKGKAIKRNHFTTMKEIIRKHIAATFSGVL